ncbi:MFS transporter [Spiractinospora alimapuensis]|uniref:MFS transporter n=1 Tax=Spiractinospora alimapuensis TaxID=2820884 RepID=UPI001F38258C|nr:MFS transporter [Spiractinospora alimapuensis]QVQ50184.1 MFS transporter [Spiractinospora alimapuensis]
MGSPSATRPIVAVTGVLALCHFLVSVDFNIVYIALPDLGREIAFPDGGLQWVVSAFSLGFGGFLLLGGRTTDRVGPRRVLVAALVLFAVASFVGGLGTTAGAVIAARAGQGLAAAFLFPATLALIGRAFAEGPDRNRAMAVWGTAGAFGALAGGGLGGVLTSTLGWRSVFFALVPLAVVALAGTLRLLPKDTAPTSSAGAGGFDVPGAILATSASLFVVFGLVRGPEAGWMSAQGIGAIGGGLVLFGAFLLVESRSRDPLVSLRLLRGGGLPIAMGLIFLVMGPVNALHYLYTTYLQDVLQYSALVAGVGFLPQGAVAMAGSALLLPRVLERWGVRGTLFAGVLGVGLTSAAFAIGMTAGGSYWTLLPGVLLLGVSAGTVYPAIFTAAGAGIAPENQGVASAMTSTAQQIGAATGLAALLAVSSLGAGMTPGPATEPESVTAGLRLAAWAGAGALVLGSLLALRFRTPDATGTDPAATSGRERDGAV